MGLKGAPNYFQRELSTQVLGGLMGNTCELYIDDLIVYGSTEEDFLERLDQVFKRLKEYNITCNPEKCRYGLSSVEYVGRVIDAEGLSITEEKRDQVLNFPLPMLFKDLQSFNGLINYFGDHLRNLSADLGELRKFHDYAKTSKRLVWNPDMIEKFNNVKNKMATLPKLYFINETGPVILYTDASDYGIGAYVAQIVDEVERPIAFMSKALSGPEKNWTTIEKECYAIYAALNKFEYLLRDIKFTLKTDHANLLYLNVPPSTKVLRWKLAIQEYDFDIEHLPGALNVVADGFSRLVENTPVHQGTVMVMTRSATDASRAKLLTVEKDGAKPSKSTDTENLPNVPTTDNEETEPILSEDKFRKISTMHNAWMGHRGVDATCKLLAEQGITWRHMQRDVQQFIKFCPTCQKQSVKRIVYNSVPYTTSSYKPHERLNADTIELAEDVDGYKAAIVIIDTCTRWAEIYPVKDLTEGNAARCFLQHFGRYGPPHEIVTDQGAQFINKVVKTLLASQDVRLLPTPIAHSHEHNSRVERCNKEVLRHIRNYCQDIGTQHDWTRAVPAVQYIINTTPNKLTGYSPFDVLFGPAVNLKRLLLEPQKLPEENVQWWEEQNTIHQGILSKAIALQKTIDEENIEKRSHEKVPTEFDVNSYVLVSYPMTLGARGRPPNKLRTILKGPLKVLEREGDKYTLLDLVSRRTEEVNISRISPFQYDSTKIDPEAVAFHDKGEFAIDKIIDAEIDLKLSKLNWNFRVRWMGYDDSHDSWLPWIELRHVKALHSYLREIGLAKYIPKSHQRLTDKPQSLNKVGASAEHRDVKTVTFSEPLLKPSKRQRTSKPNESA